MPDSDRRLVERTLGGDTDAFGDLVERYWEPVHGLALEKTRSPDDADDVAQDAFSKAFLELAQLRDPTRFGMWLRRITTNLALEWWRQRDSRERRHQAPDVLALYHPSPGPAEILESQDASDRLWEAMDRLPPEHRQALVLYYVEGCTERAMAHFLGVSSPTIHWRLYRARRRLSAELRQVLVGDMRRRQGRGREAREKVSAILPPLAILRPAKRRLLERWGLRALVAVGCVGLAGLPAIISRRSSPLDASTSLHTPRAQQAFYVHRERRALPSMSVHWEPRSPRAGDLVRITAAGPDLGSDGGTPELHFLIETRYPIDHAIPMQPDADAWSARISIPGEARAVFFYVSPRKEGPHDLQRIAYLSTEKLLRRYGRGFPVCDASGVPVAGSRQLQAEMARLQGAPSQDVLDLLDREIRRYPQQFGAHRARWQVLLEQVEQSPEIKAAVRAEQEELRRRHDSSPELLWHLAAIRPDDRTQLYRELVQRFPGHGRADEALYRLSLQYGMTDNWQQRAATLEQLIDIHPQSPYVDEAARDLLLAVAHVDPGRATELADSLLRKGGTLTIAPALEQQQKISRAAIGGSLPNALAYSLLHDLLSLQGDFPQATALAEGLVHSQVRDPGPYLYIGRRLAGLACTSRLIHTTLQYPHDVPLAIEVLTAGLPYATSEYARQLPGFLTLFGPEHSWKAQRESQAEEMQQVRWALLHALGQACVADRQYDRAIRHLEEALHLQRAHLGDVPPDPKTAVLLGQIHERSADWEKAEQAYVRAFDHWYTHPVAESGLERVHLARYGGKGRLRAALAESWNAGLVVRESVGDQVGNARVKHLLR